jgi:putative endonuclease
MITIYLLHFQRPIGNLNNPRGQAQHYIGSTVDLKKRLAQHRSGKSAPIVAAFKRQGIGFKVARTWESEDRSYESHLKKHYKSARQLCPICNPNLRH